MMPAPASAARAEPAAAPRPVPADLPGQYADWLARRGRGNRCFAGGAAGSLRRWPAPQSFAAEPLEVMLAQDRHTRPFITFLLLHDLLRPGYDYLAGRKFAGLIDLARGTRLEQDLDGFQRAAAELGFSPHVCSRAAARVMARLLIQTGRRLHDLTAGDLREAEAAFRERGERRGRDWSNDRGFLHAAWTVLFHLGIVEVTPPNRRRHEHAGHAHHFGGIPAWLAARLEDYATAVSGTYEDSTMDGIAIRLAHFGRHLAAADPGLDSLADLDRQRHIETYLAAVATARASRGGQPISAREQRNRVITLGRFLADITEWQWPDAPARRLVFTRDIPKLPRALPRYLPADADRRIAEALHASPDRLFAGALLLARATGLRLGELRDLELDCVHEVPGTGAWLKVPLGKLGTERMVPLDDNTIALIDRITETRSPGALGGAVAAGGGAAADPGADVAVLAGQDLGGLIPDPGAGGGLAGVEEAGRRLPQVGDHVDQVDQDLDLDLAFGGEGVDGGDLAVVAVHDGEPGPGVLRVAAVRLGECLRDDLAGGPADRREHLFPSASGPGAGRGASPPAGRSGPNRAVMMSSAVRGAGGMSATAASSAVRLRALRRSAGSSGSSGQPLSAAACARAFAAFAVAGRSACGSTGNADPSQLISNPVSGGHGSGSRDT
jgi:site-specific recombinase XerD